MDMSSPVYDAGWKKKGDLVKYKWAQEDTCDYAYGLIEYSTLLVTPVYPEPGALCEENTQDERLKSGSPVKGGVLPACSHVRSVLWFI